MQDYAEQLEQKLTEKYGFVLGSDPLFKLLGYPTINALKQGVIRNQISVPIFSIENRRGKFALTKDVAEWLAMKRLSAICETEKKVCNMN